MSYFRCTIQFFGLGCIIAFGVAILSSTLVLALEDPGEELQSVGLSTTLGAQIDPDLVFTASDGEAVRLGEILEQGKPVVITPVYYRCPRLCGLFLDGVTTLLAELELKLGEDYRLLTVSFDESEGPDLAETRRAGYHAKLIEALEPHGPDVEQQMQLLTERLKADWEFAVSVDGSGAELMRQLGFEYRRDKADFAHTAALMILTPQGIISQYFTGVRFSAWDVRLALIEASQGAIGSMLDHVLLYCFRFDPTKGKYTWAAFNVMRIGGILTLVCLVGFIFWAAKRA